MYMHPEQTGGTRSAWRIVTHSLLVAASVFAGASAAQADSNPAPFAVPLIGTQGQASPYPSRITVDAIGGPTHTSSVRIELHNVTHPCPEDLAVLLVHNQTDKFLLMANAGGCRPLQGTSLSIVTPNVLSSPLADDYPEPYVPYPERALIEPSIYGDPPEFPGVPGPYTLGLPPDTTNVNGTWDLYIMDTRPGARGVIDAGWSLHYFLLLEQTSDQVNVPIPDQGTPAAYPITIDLSDAPENITLGGFMELRLQLSHTHPDDLRVVLQSPSGRSVVLMANAGGSDDLEPGHRIYFTGAFLPIPDDGPILNSGVYRPGGSYAPEVSLPAPGPEMPYDTSLDAFDGEPIRGIWTLWIADDTAGDSGMFENATLRMNTALAPSFSLDTPTNQPATTATAPFVEIGGPVTGYTVQHAAHWRSVVDGVYYASGPMTLAPGGGRLTASVPLKHGSNVIEVSTYSLAASVEQDAVTIDVDEFTYYLTEGATGSFFDLDVVLGNFSAAAAPVTLDFLPSAGPVVPHANSVEIDAPLSVRGDDFVPSGDAAVVVHSTDAVPLAVERTMTWDTSGYGGHSGTAVYGPSTRWIFAEGAQGFFQTYLLLANDHDQDTSATIRFLREGADPIVIDRVVAANSRLTIDAGAVPGVVDSSFGIDVTSTLTITAERAMYFPSVNVRPFEGGHETAGVTGTHTRWFLAEGATGPFFDSFILVSNPNNVAAQVEFTYLLPGGGTVVRNAVVAANSRLTVNVEGEDAALLNTPVSTTVTANVGVVVERSMYWPAFAEGWQEAHASTGITESGLRWGVSDGRTGGASGHETFILLANPGAQPAEVEVRFLQSGLAPVTKTLQVPGTSRHTIRVLEDVPELAAGTFAAEVRVVNYQPIVVERATYWNADGIIWAGGSNATATLLPPQ